MTRRVLVVDDVATNVRVLSNILKAEYYEVRAASTIAEAEKIANSGWPDLIAQDVYMPDGDGVELCRRLKQSDLTQNIPIIIITGSESPSKRLEALEVGADDFLVKPVEPLALFTRIRALFRLRDMMTEVMYQARNSEAGWLARAMPSYRDVGFARARIMWLSDDHADARKLKKRLEGDQARVIVVGPEEVASTAAVFHPEVVCLQLDSKQFDGLRVVSQLRALETTADCSIVVVSADPQDSLLTRALEMEVNDYQVATTCLDELSARLRTQVRRHRYIKLLREHFRFSLQAAVTDDLTGLYNRLYMMRELDRQIAISDSSGSMLSLLMIDIDHFKHVNDTWGHQVGDEILVEFAQRLRVSIRVCDLPCRYGGEEFVAIMPDASGDQRSKIAERLRADVSRQPFITKEGHEVHITASIGTATFPHPLVNDANDLMHQADLALYEAKRNGRNQVVDQPAA